MMIFAGLAKNSRLVQIWVICITNRMDDVNANNSHIVAFQLF